ncbi:type I polyketide synthase [Allorhizocola rhizosphaerae]|uniref:type I polyketide synthase n=1 Tax=Allorhizocola rhizosphaerae TaxID=1872709 RepID=UPI000E3E6A07|nr:type I polyketide synthase [Allorhizocola rhizosphaerae]
MSTSHVAVIGMAGRFPGASNVDEFWRNLADGIESITHLPSEPGGPVTACGILADADCFDADFFGFAPRDALLLDPQHRLLLECAWHALEHAGYDPARTTVPIGVYAGSSHTAYSQYLAAHRHELDGVGDFALRLGTGMDFLTTRVSYKLGLTGPAVTVQTACSTSLVAIHLAGQALLAGECDVALAGGVTAHVPTYAGEYSADGILAADGHCRAFDAHATGTVGGDGVGLVVLKRLDDALADGDTIHAVVRGSAINNDGNDKIGYSAPSISGQVGAITTALALAEADAASVSYVEAHGTGTPLGDPIEVAALIEAFGPGAGHTYLGSVKTNIGHVDAAAGVAGFIKTVQALRHRQLPPSLHFTAADPAVDFGGFEVVTTLRDWSSAGPRRAGVSSLGIGGTNAHVVLEEAPATEPSTARRHWHLVPITARTPSALSRAIADLAAVTEPVADVAWTMQSGRRHHTHRRFAVVATGASLTEALAGDLLGGRAPASPGPMVFAFPGQGGQHPGLTRQLYQHEPAYAARVDECAALFARHLRLDLREVLFGHDPDAEELIDRMPVAQACVFTVEYALAGLWHHWGIRPDAVVGHSLGAYAAACVAGVFDLPDAVALVALRGRIFEGLPPGAMVAVPLPEAELLDLLGDDLAVAAVNAPDQCVISGPIDAVDRLEKLLGARDVEVRRLHISAAAHSTLVDAVWSDFHAAVAALRLNPPALPMISDHTGGLLPPERAVDPAYWADHLRGTVRFAAAIEVALGDGDATVLEVGPGRTLTTLAARHPAHGPRHTCVASLPHVADPTPEPAHLLETAGRLWVAGHEPDWARLHDGERRRRVPLPGYPFQRMRFHVDPDPAIPIRIEPMDQGLDEEPGDEYEPPRTEIERQIAGRFEHILGVERVGLHHNFLRLGGDSLIAAQLAAWIRNTYRVPLSVRTIFKSPTVAGLAGVVTSLVKEHRDV